MEMHLGCKWIDQSKHLCKWAAKPCGLLENGYLARTSQFPRKWSHSLKALFSVARSSNWLGIHGSKKIKKMWVSYPSLPFHLNAQNKNVSSVEGTPCLGNWVRFLWGGWNYFQMSDNSASFLSLVKKGGPSPKRARFLFLAIFSFVSCTADIVPAWSGMVQMTVCATMTHWQRKLQPKIRPCINGWVLSSSPDHMTGLGILKYSTAHRLVNIHSSPGHKLFVIAWHGDLWPMPRYTWRYLQSRKSALSLQSPTTHNKIIDLQTNQSVWRLQRGLGMKGVLVNLDAFMSH